MDVETNSALQSTLDELAHLLINPSRLTIAKGIGSGGYGEVSLATLDGSTEVAVKELRIIGAQAAETRARVALRLARELKVWAKAKHPNVLELVGYHLSPNYGRAQFISPYMSNGNIIDYMKRTQASADARLGFVRDITSGMAYLHSCDPPICHGDLKPANVLINDEPGAVLCDFGLATFIEASGASSGLTTSRSTKGSTRYMSPELFQANDAKHTLESDVWAWACTVFEIITDKTPYSNAEGDASVILALTQGTPPASMESLNSLALNAGPPVPLRSAIATLRLLIPECWSTGPEKRPKLSDILKRLEQAGLRRAPTDPSPAGPPDRGGPTSRLADLIANQSTNGRSTVSVSHEANDGAQRGAAELEAVLSISGAHTLEALSFAPNGKWLATEWSDLQARLWNLEDLSASPVTFPSGRGKFHWSPDSRYLVLPLFSEEIRIWSAESFKSGQLQITSKAKTIYPLFFVRDMATIPMDRVGGRRITVIVGFARSPHGAMEWLRGGVSSILFKETTMIVYDTDARKVLSRARTDRLIIDNITISTDGEFALLTAGGQPELWRLQIPDSGQAPQNMQFIRRYSFYLGQDPIPYARGPAYFGRGNDNEWVISITEKGDVFIWDAQSPDPLHVIELADPSSGEGSNVATLLYPLKETGVVVLATSRIGEKRIFLWRWSSSSKPT
ncbi:hypothetical protein FRC01_009030 [Tulasnella sp. 417]|nr:hypothetical protein FRC01_009030 [Tulasnella sp. 417]